MTLGGVAKMMHKLKPLLKDLSSALEPNLRRKTMILKLIKPSHKSVFESWEEKWCSTNYDCQLTTLKNCSN